MHSLTAIVLLGILATGSAITCYTCTTDSYYATVNNLRFSSKCAETNTDTTTATGCNSCMKQQSTAVIEGNTYTTYTRVCSSNTTTADSCSGDFAYSVADGTITGNVKECFCTTDMCNAAGLVKASLLSLLAALFFVNKFMF